jgi:uncharacterized protein (DUF58 family)
MRRGNIILIVILLFLIAALFVYINLFRIYEVEISVVPKELFADNQSTVTISVHPLNSIGKRIWFRTVSARFKIVEGSELVTTRKLDEEKGYMILQAKNNTGVVSILVTTKKSLLPSFIKININPNYAEAKY